MKPTHENKPVPVEEEAVSEEFPTDLQILLKLLECCEEQEGYPQQIDFRGFELQFDGKVDPAKVLNRVMELEQEYLKMAGRSDSESSLVLPEDKLKSSVAKMIWHRECGHIDQFSDIELLRNILECSTKKQDYPSRKDDAKRIKKLQKKYLSCLKIDKHSTSSDDEEFYRLSSILWVWDGKLAGSSEVSGQELKPSGSPVRIKTLDDFQDNEILNCAIRYHEKNNAYPYTQSQLISMCRDFLHIDVKDVFLVGERFARLRWKYMIYSYDQQVFKLSRSLWGDTLEPTSNQDSTEESSSGGEEDNTDKNKNAKKDDQSPKR